jgi:hypothetical protein
LLPARADTTLLTAPLSLALPCASSDAAIFLRVVACAFLPCADRTAFSKPLRSFDTDSELSTDSSNTCSAVKKKLDSNMSPADCRAKEDVSSEEEST